MLNNRDDRVRYNRATDRSRLPSFAELWQYRYLVLQLILREFKSRYTQSVLGILWIAIAPIMTMIVYTFVFDRLANVPSYDIPYPVFSFAALVPWGYFASSITLGSKSILMNKQFVTDIYIPRIIIPVVTQFTGMIDMLISFTVFLILMGIFGMLPANTSIFLLVFVLQLFLLTTGFSFILSSFQVRFRDIGPLTSYILQIFVFLSPVAYPTDIVDSALRNIYSLNPMVAILDGWRWAVIGTDTLDWTTTAISWIVTLVVFAGGMVLFSRSESTFVDWI